MPRRIPPIESPFTYEQMYELIKCGAIKTSSVESIINDAKNARKKLKQEKK